MQLSSAKPNQHFDKTAAPGRPFAFGDS